MAQFGIHFQGLLAGRAMDCLTCAIFKAHSSNALTLRAKFVILFEKTSEAGDNPLTRIPSFLCRPRLSLLLAELASAKIEGQYGGP